MRAFQPTAEQRSLWLVGQYDDALRVLRAAILGRQGLQLLVGEPGTGKTVLAHALATHVRDEGLVVGCLLHPILEGMDLRGAVAEALALSPAAGDHEALHEQLRSFVADAVATARRVLLVIDEAQALTTDVLLEVARLPYAVMGGGAPCMSVLLVGHRQVLHDLRAGGVEPDVLWHLRPLTREQTADYIAHRLRAAGHRGRLFTPPALRKLWISSEGIPRSVNALCVAAIGELAGTSRRKVTAPMVDRPHRERDDDPPLVPQPVAETPAPAPLPSGPPEDPRSTEIPRVGPSVPEPARLTAVQQAMSSPPPITIALSARSPEPEGWRRRVRPKRRRHVGSLVGGLAIAAVLLAVSALSVGDRAVWPSAQPAVAPTSVSPAAQDPIIPSSVPPTTDPALSVSTGPGLIPTEAPDAGRAPLTPTPAADSPAIGAGKVAPAAPAGPGLQRGRREDASSARDARVARPADSGDASAIIDWLLRERRGAGHQSLD